MLGGLLNAGIASLSLGIQAVLTCFEMFLAAIVHRKVWTYKDYRTTLNQRQFDFWGAIKHSFDNRPLWHQVLHVLRHSVTARCVAAMVNAVRK